jgi:DNA polymerase IV
VRLRLTDLGYRRIGQVARAPLRSLVSQFGREAHRIQECALGRFPDPVRPLYPPDAVAAEVRFDQPVADSLALGEAVARLASELAGSLSQRHQVGSDLWLCVRLESGATTVRKRRLAKPAHRATTLRVALAAELDRARPSEPVESLKALMPRLSANPGGQTRLFVSSGSAEPERAAEAAFRTVRAAFGDSAIEVASRLAPPRRERVLREWRRATGWR